MPGRAAPLVSVVVPAWNSAATLDETLRSVSAQTYSSIEVIIVDDGSTDSTAQVAAEYCAREPRARLIRQSNGGVASARNRAIAEARGEWVAPIDADDLWHPGKLDKQVAAALAAAEPPGFVYCWYHYIDESSRVIGSRTGWVTRGRALRQLAYENFVGNGSAALFRRSAVLEVGGYDSSLRARRAQGCEDLLMQMLIVRTWAVAAVPEYLVGYRVRPGAMSGDCAQMLRSWQLVFDTLRERGIELPPRLVRWSLGIEMLGTAEAVGRSGDRRTALRLLGNALRFDPLRCGLTLAYRACRLAARLVRGRRDRPGPVPFGQADSKSAVELDADSLPGFSALLRRLDERRLERLRVQDDACPAPRSPP